MREMQQNATRWVRTQIPGVTASFRCTDFCARAITYASGVNQLVIYEQSTTNSKTWRAILDPSEPGPPAGTRLHIVFEVCLDDKVHPIPMARAPTVGCFTDWEKANKIALRIEWQDDAGVWVHRYYQMPDSDERVEGAPAGGVQGYNVAAGLYSYLLQERRQLSPHFKDWLFDFGVAKVKEVFLDRQTYEPMLHDLWKSTDVPGPQTRFYDQIGQALVNAGAHRYAAPHDSHYPLFADGRHE